jgi:hypothetical protein
MRLKMAGLTISQKKTLVREKSDMPVKKPQSLAEMC